MKVAIAILFIVITLVLGSSHTALPLSDFCSNRCRERCSKAGSEERCFKYCGICCEDCKCVPSGTYGNKQECPCYRDKKNSKGNPKCP